MKSLPKLLSHPTEKLLIYGIGNVGRQDDGQGIRLIEKLETTVLSSNISIEANYQLNIEDALVISQFDAVLFLDASLNSSENVSIEIVEPRPAIGFSTHAMGIPEVVYLCQSLYGRKPKVYLMELPGEKWDLGEDLSDQAKRNIDQAYRYLLEVFQCTKFPS